jgi:predicted nucleotidyltransferase
MDIINSPKNTWFKGSNASRISIDQSDLSGLVYEMTNKHNCHTIIIYGSRARGTHNENSDIDLACFKENGEPYTDCRLREGLYLDAWIYPDNHILEPGENLKLLNGKVLVQKENFGDALLKKVNEFYKKGPEKLKDTERMLEITWCQKTLKRALRGDIEGNYRRLGLISSLLEYYFKLGNKWYLGPKDSLSWLKENDPNIYKCFELLFASPERNDYLEEAVEFVTGILPEHS